MTTLVDNGDTEIRFDWLTSELVVSVVGQEVIRVKANRLFLAYHEKITPVLNPDVQMVMGEALEEDPCPSDDQIFATLLDGFGARLLGQRDRARDAGDRLATVVLELLNRRPGTLKARRDQTERVLEALRCYAQMEGWGGPAMSWLRKAILRGPPIGGKG